MRNEKRRESFRPTGEWRLQPEQHERWSPLQLPGNSWRKIPASETLVDPRDKRRHASLENSMRTCLCEFFADQSDSKEVKISQFRDCEKAFIIAKCDE